MARNGDSLPSSPVERYHRKAPEATDFVSLKKQFLQVPARPTTLTVADALIQMLTPLLIFMMTLAVVYFLLDVRYVYTEVQDTSLRWVAFCFILGIVAINRLVAVEGREDSFLYVVVFAGAMGLYTVAMTSQYGGVGSVARNFLDAHPMLAVAFNMTLVVFIWWAVNRLTHECCVDENPSAGEVGILTGTARRAQAALERRPEKLERKPFFIRRSNESVIPTMELQAIDPTEYDESQLRRRKPTTVEPASKRLPKRHPGISIFYFTVPVMILFAVGLRVIQHGGDFMILASHFYVGVYTFSALMLLMLSSYAGLRAYFSSRNIPIPGGISAFWLGLGTVMVIVVAVAATALPLPGLPELAAIDHHETDYWTRASTFQPTPVTATAVKLAAQSRFIERIRIGVLVVLGLFLAYGALRAVGAAAAAIGQRRDRYPQWVVRLFDATDRLLQRITRLPSLPKLRRKKRIQRNIACSAKYNNPLGTSGPGLPETPAEQVMYAYEALGALAHDLGVPRMDGETPLEFIQRFPAELNDLRSEALDLTNLYHIAAYSPHQLDERVYDRLRRFWLSFRRVRNHYVR
jgi:hypothetical protein